MASDAPPAPTQRAPPTADRFLGRKITPLTRRRLDSFCRNRRGFWSLWIFLAIFLVTLFAEFIANDRPVLVRFDGAWYFPVFADYPETSFGGEFPTKADYRDPAVMLVLFRQPGALAAVERQLAGHRRPGA